MKKIVSTILASALALSLCACSTTEPTQEATLQTSQEVDLANETTNKILDETAEPSQSEEQYQVYSLNGMSGEEISNLIISLSTGISTGDTMDNYADRFTVKPCPPPYSSSMNDFYYAFWGSESVYYGIETSKPSVTDYIDGVSRFYSTRNGWNSYGQRL